MMESHNTEARPITERALHALSAGELIDLLLELERIQEQAEALLMKRQAEQKKHATRPDLDPDRRPM